MERKSGERIVALGRDFSLSLPSASVIGSERYEKLGGELFRHR